MSHLQNFKIREQVNYVEMLVHSLYLFLQIFLRPGLILNHKFFTGLMFRFILTPTSRQQRSPRLRTAAIGGVYDSLLSRMRAITGATTVGAGPPNITPSSIVGVAITEEILTNRAANAVFEGQVRKSPLDHLTLLSLLVHIHQMSSHCVLVRKRLTARVC